MFFLQFLFLLSVSTIIIVVTEADPNDLYEKEYGEIIFSSVFIRHGDRAPFKLYAGDRNDPKTIWPNDLANLTEKGQIGSNDIGKWFRKRYNLLLGKQGINVRESVSVDSTEVPRTKMSANCFLKGFFQPNNEPENCANYDPRVEITPRPILGFLENCEKYNKERDGINRDDQVKEVYSSYKTTFETIEQCTNEKFSDSTPVVAIEKAYFLYDTLFIKDLYNVPFTDSEKKVSLKYLKEIAKRHLPINVKTDVMKRLRTGPLIELVINDMKSKIGNKSDNTVLHLYSGHESTVSSLLDTLIDAVPGSIYNIWPSYSSSIFFELRLKNDKYFVTVLYKDSPEAEPELLTIKGCGETCSFEDFETKFEDMIPKNWKAECDAQ